MLCLNSSTACLITIATCFDLCFPSSLLLTDFATYLLFFLYSSNFFAVMYTCMTVLYHLQFATTRRYFWIPGHGSPPKLIGVMGIEHPLLPKQAWKKAKSKLHKVGNMTEHYGIAVDSLEMIWLCSDLFYNRFRWSCMAASETKFCAVTYRISVACKLNCWDLFAFLTPEIYCWFRILVLKRWSRELIHIATHSCDRHCVHCYLLWVASHFLKKDQDIVLRV